MMTNAAFHKYHHVFFELEEQKAASRAAVRTPPPVKKCGLRRERPLSRSPMRFEAIYSISRLGVTTRILFSFPRGLRARSASEGQSPLPSLALRAFKVTAMGIFKGEALG